MKRNRIYKVLNFSEFRYFDTLPFFVNLWFTNAWFRDVLNVRQCFKMDPNGMKWFKIVQNGQKSFKLDVHSPNCSKLSELSKLVKNFFFNYPKYSEFVYNDLTWFEMFSNSPKLSQMPYCVKWFQEQWKALCPFFLTESYMVSKLNNCQWSNDVLWTYL